MTEHQLPYGATAPFIYTLLAYRPNGSRWSRGECESRSDADFEFTSGDRATIAEHYAEFRCLGRDPGEEHYELTVLINGRVASTDANSYRYLSGPNDYIDEYEAGDTALYAELQLWQAESTVALKRHTEAALAAQEKARLAAAQKKTAAAAKKAEAEKLKELAELARLQDKYKQ